MSLHELSAGPPAALLTVEEMARELRVGRTKAFRLVGSGEIESIVIGGRSRRVPRQALDAYIAQVRADSHAGALKTSALDSTRSEASPQPA